MVFLLDDVRHECVNRGMDARKDAALLLCTGQPALPVHAEQLAQQSDGKQKHEAGHDDQRKHELVFPAGWLIAGIRHVVHGVLHSMAVDA